MIYPGFYPRLPRLCQTCLVKHLPEGGNVILGLFKKYCDCPCHKHRIKKSTGCSLHKDEGFTCTEVIAMGKCSGENCRLFKKVLNILPKLKKKYEMEARGIILHTVWRFDEESEKKRLKKKRKAERWLNEFYPKIEQQLSNMGFVLSFNRGKTT